MMNLLAIGVKGTMVLSLKLIDQLCQSHWTVSLVIMMSFLINLLRHVNCINLAYQTSDSNLCDHLL